MTTIAAIEIDGRAPDEAERKRRLDYLATLCDQLFPGEAYVLISGSAGTTAGCMTNVSQAELESVLGDLLSQMQGGASSLSH